MARCYVNSGTVSYFSKGISTSTHRHYHQPCPHSRSSAYYLGKRVKFWFSYAFTLYVLLQVLSALRQRVASHPSRW